MKADTIKLSPEQALELFAVNEKAPELIHKLFNSLGSTMVMISGFQPLPNTHLASNQAGIISWPFHAFQHHAWKSEENRKLVSGDRFLVVHRCLSGISVFLNEFKESTVSSSDSIPKVYLSAELIGGASWPNSVAKASDNLETAPLIPIQVNDWLADLGLSDYEDYEDWAG